MCCQGGSRSPLTNSSSATAGKKTSQKGRTSPRRSLERVVRRRTCGTGWHRNSRSLWWLRAIYLYDRADAAARQTGATAGLLSDSARLGLEDLHERTALGAEGGTEERQSWEEAKTRVA